MRDDYFDFTDFRKSDLKINENVYISYQLRNGNTIVINIDIWVNEKK